MICAVYLLVLFYVLVLQILLTSKTAHTAVLVWRTEKTAKQLQLSTPNPLCLYDPHALFTGGGAVPAPKPTQGFSVQGKLDSSGTESSYIVKCVYVEGPLEGFVMDGLSVENCG